MAVRKKAKAKNAKKKAKAKKTPKPKSRKLKKVKGNARAKSKGRSKQAAPPVAPQPDAPQPVAPQPIAIDKHLPSGFQVEGSNANALFTLKLHRGEGMTLVAMNWKNNAQPPQNFVGFAIEYREPGSAQFVPLTNRLGFLDAQGNVDPQTLSTLQSPIQKFRWVHFPRNADLVGDFLYRVTPMFMDASDKLTAGEPQSAAIQLARETYPGIANVTFTRGFVSSQAFVDRYGKDGDATNVEMSPSLP
jgi:hypothetical protein